MPRIIQTNDPINHKARHKPDNSHYSKQTQGKQQSAATRGSAWVIGAHGSGQLLRLLGNLIMTRMLTREAFGLMALVTVVFQGLRLFSDIGIAPSIIQHERGEEPSFYNTAWSMQVVRGLAIWFCGCVVAVPFAKFYGEEMLALILPVSTFAAVLAGFNSTSMITFNRRLQMGKLSLIEITAQVTGLITMIIWALIDRSVWALVAGGIATAFASLTLSHLWSGDVNNRLHWDRNAAVSLFRFGRWIFLSTLLTFFVSRTDRLIFGKLITIEMLGVYSIGLSIAMMPFEVLVQISTKIIFPVYSRMNNERKDLGTVFGPVRLPLLLFGGWVLSGFIAGGTTIVDILFDARYRGAGWIVQCLSVGSWFMILGDSNMAALLAKGEAKWVAATNIGKLVTMAAFIPLGYVLAEFPGAVIGIAASNISLFTVSAIGANRQGMRAWSQSFLLTFWVALAGCCGLWVAERSRALGINEIGTAFALFFLVTLVWSPFAYSQWKKRHTFVSLFSK